MALGTRKYATEGSLGEVVSCERGTPVTLPCPSQARIREALTAMDSAFELVETLHHTPYTTSYTRHHTPYTLNPQPSTLNPKP